MDSLDFTDNWVSTDRRKDFTLDEWLNDQERLLPNLIHIKR